jgi:hypothetical protein
VDLKGLPPNPFQRKGRDKRYVILFISLTIKKWRPRTLSKSNRKNSPPFGRGWGWALIYENNLLIF